jgi:hypothetical protein
VSKAKDEAIIDDMHKFFQGLDDPNYRGPDKSKLLTIDQTVSDQPFTVFQAAAVCYVADEPPDAQYLIREFEMPATFFNSQTPIELRHAYYTAWSLFNYGDDRPGLQYDGSRLDASIIRRAADLVAQNRPVVGEDLTAVGAYLREVQQLARADIERKKVSCLSSRSK